MAMILIGLLALLLALISGYFILKWVLSRRSRSAAPKTVPPNKLSLDELYAREKKLWVCAYCDTLNKKSSSVCAACGKSR